MEKDDFMSKMENLDKPDMVSESHRRQLKLLAVMHFQYDAAIREVQVALKLRWLNICVILFCFSIFMIFFVYLLLENVGHP